MYKEKWIGTSSCYHTETKHPPPAPPPPPVSPRLLFSFCLYCHFIHNARIHSSVPRRGELNESRDSACALCCKKRCFSPRCSTRCLLWCLNVYLEQLGGLKDKCMVQENCLGTIPLFPGWKYNDTISRTRPSRVLEWCFDEAAHTTLFAPLSKWY